jgi:hypothetical protein
MDCADGSRGETVHVFKVGLIYFALVFGTGFVLGPIRVLWLVPRVGQRAAELIEAPVMLLAMVLASRWVVRRFGRSCGRGTLLGAGLLAAGLVVGADLAVGVYLRGMSPAQVFRGRDPVSGTVYYGLLCLFALLPWLWGRRVRDSVAAQAPQGPF